jgi:hypothetical protein
MPWQPEPSPASIPLDITAEEYAAQFPCVGSGLCCFVTLCEIGTERYPGQLPCPGLVHDGDRYFCGEVLKASPEERARFTRELAFGWGCGSRLANQARELMRWMEALLSGDVERAPASANCRSCDTPIGGSESFARNGMSWHIECAYRFAYVRCAQEQERAVEPSESEPGREAARAVFDAAKRRAAQKAEHGETLYALRIMRGR